MTLPPAARAAGAFHLIDRVLKRFIAGKKTHSLRLVAGATGLSSLEAHERHATYWDVLLNTSLEEL